MLEQGTVSDRTICSLAIVKVAFDRRKSFLSYFEPFLEHRLLKATVNVVSIPDLQDAIEEDFGLRLPQAVIKTLLRRQEQQGHVTVEHGTCRIQRDTLLAADLESDRQDAKRKQGALIEALNEYVEKKFGEEWTGSYAQDLLVEYVQTFSGRLLAATVAGKPLPDLRKDGALHRYMVHHFVLHALTEDPRSFEFLTVLVKGKMLSDAVYLGEPEIQEGVEPLTNVEVYFDTPILLRLLGYAGKEMVAPYLELLEMLKRQGAITRCFVDNLEEARRILRAAERGAATDGVEHARGDVVAHLARTGASPSDIAMMANRLSSDLLKLGIQPVELPPPDSRHATDEDALKALLESRIPSYKAKPMALQADVNVLAAVHKLRRGEAAQTLPKCKAVFVTRNYEMFKVSAEFFQPRSPGPTVPSCIPMSAFTTMVWVREPLSAPDLPEERVIADAVAAMSPSAETWKEFDEEIERLRGTDGISIDDAQRLRVDGELERALADENVDDDQTYAEGSPEDVQERARERQRQDLRKREEEARRQRESIEGIARKAGRIAARFLFAAVIPLLALGVVFGPLGLLNGSPSPVPRPVQWIATLVFCLLSLWSLFVGLSLRHAARGTASAFEALAVRLVRRFVADPKEAGSADDAS